jgi:predicted glycogen debranching enzyme
MIQRNVGAKPIDWVDWQGPQDGPWPSVFVNGDLEAAESEWFTANNLGAYSMSTVALMHTRRQHGLLVSHLAEDFHRHVVLSHMEMSLSVGGRTHSLSTHQFPNMAPTLGYRGLEAFTQDPLPRWVYRFSGGTIERTVSLVHNRQAVVIALTWSGKEPARLNLRPLMPMRRSEELCSEHGGMLQKVTLRCGQVEVQPLAHLPAVLFQHDGVFMGFPDWWRKFEYLDDRGRYEEFQEDMWSPGVFEFVLTHGVTRYLVVSVGAPPEEEPADLVMDAAQRRLRADPSYSLGEKGTNGEAPSIQPEVRALCVAAENFVFGGGTAIVAGYPWLDSWSRDTLLALSGIFLARGQVQRARRAIRHLLRNQMDGFLVDRTTCPESERRPCVDASLWLFSVGSSVMSRSRDDIEFCDDVFSAMVAIFGRICSERREFAWLSSDGLLVNGAEFALTWMEGSFEGKFYTPRSGLAVEFQALWVSACEVLTDEAERRGNVVLAREARARAETAKSAFRNTFWCRETNHPLDCLSEKRESSDAETDASIRPNAVMALAIAPQLFEAWQASEILDRAEELLLTRRGLRTLDPRDPSYVGHAGPAIVERAAASHQGAVWPHLLLFYVRAKLRHNSGEAGRMRELVIGALKDGRALGHIGQIADGDEPHRFWGIPACAMATGMLLEALVSELGERAL